MTYAANLQRVGLVAEETRVLLTAYSRCGDWEEVRRQTVDGNLLGKRSTTTAREIAKVVARRYRTPGCSLPGLGHSARFFARAGIPERARTQVAFLYTVAEDELAAALLQSLVLHRLRADAATLRGGDVLQDLRTLEADHPEIGRWGSTLRRYWASAYLTLLRDGGFMLPAPSTTLTRPSILPQAFAFVFGWFARSNGSPKAALEHCVISLWALDPVELRTLLAEGQDRGWWTFAFRGDLFDFRHGCRSHEELIDAMG